MEQLAKLLGGIDRVKTMRLFLHHPETLLNLKDVTNKTKSKLAVARKEVNTLLSIGFLEKKKNKIFSISGKGRKAKPVVKETQAFILNQHFPHNDALKDLLFHFESFDKKRLLDRFKSVGRIKVFLVSGIFIGYKAARVDILIVGEAIKREKAEKVFEQLSSEVGRDITYAIMDIDEYDYRIKMYDKFVRDVLDMPHERLIDKLTKKDLEK